MLIFHKCLVDMLRSFGKLANDALHVGLLDSQSAERVVVKAQSGACSACVFVRGFVRTPFG